jgi:8-oxo-dGTP diphosphatase
VTDAIRGAEADGPWGEADPGAVHAAGGVVRRPMAAAGAGPAPHLEVLVVHRPRYDDWSLPKGKCDPGETFAETAAREVREETGLTCALDQPWAELHYVDHKGRDKVVRYWTMTVVSGDVEDFEPNDEVDVVAWLPWWEARDRLSYPHDAALVARLGSE